MANRILIVDGSELNRKLLAVIFGDMAEIIYASSGEEAVKIMMDTDQRMDIVLLALKLPGMNGFDVLEKRREMEFFKEIPVVMFSDSRDVEDQMRAFELGVSDYIIRPFMAEIAKARVKNAIKSRQICLQKEQQMKQMLEQEKQNLAPDVSNKLAAQQYMDQYMKEKEKNIILVISKNMDIVNSMENQFSEQFSTIAIPEIEMSVTMNPDWYHRLAVIYVDISDRTEESSQIWIDLKDKKYFQNIPVVAICQEGNMKQMKEAVLAGVEDLLTTPLEVNILKRRNRIHTGESKQN